MTALIEQLIALAKRPHYSCEDCWYSCPKDPGYCGNQDINSCLCGADIHNAEVDALAAQIRKELKSK